MARRLSLWTLDNPGLTYQEALMWESLWQLATCRATRSLRTVALAPEGSPARTDSLRAGLFSPDFLSEMRSAQRFTSGS